MTITITIPDSLNPRELNELCREAVRPTESRGITWRIAQEHIQASEDSKYRPSYQRMGPLEQAVVESLSLWALHYKAVKRNPHVNDPTASFVHAALRRAGDSNRKRDRVRHMAQQITAEGFARIARPLTRQMDPNAVVNYVALAWDFWRVNTHRDAQRTRARWLRDAYIYTPKTDTVKASNTNTDKEELS